MKQLICLTLVLALPTFAQDVPQRDVPTATVTLTEKEFDLTLQRLARLDAENKQLKQEIKDFPPPVWVTVVVGVLAAGAGVGLGYAVARAVGQPPAPNP